MNFSHYTTQSEMKTMSYKKSMMSCQLNTINVYFELSMLLQVMQTLNFTQVSQTMQHLEYYLTICNLLVIFLCTLALKNTEHTLEVDNEHGRPRSLSPEQDLFMVLVRLRCGLLNLDIANRFGISQAQYSRIENTWLAFLYHRLRALPIWASHEHVQQTMPQSFRDAYPKTRVIIDCTEIYIEMPTSFRSQSATYSSYKNHNTAKGLIGISPAGYPSFISELYAGRTSDKQITKDCGILCMLEPGDDLMADRGFDIEDDMPDGVTLNIPPFLNGAPQLSVSD